MQRNITLSKTSQVYLNAIIDLERLTSEVYSQVRDSFSPDDSVEDKTGQDIIDASNKLRDIIQGLFDDNLNYSLTLVKNLTSQEAVL